MSCRTRTWLPPAAEDDTHQKDYTHSPLPDGSLSSLIYLELVLPQTACDPEDVNVTLCECCLLFFSWVCVRVRQSHRNCCLELSTTSLATSFPPGLHAPLSVLPLTLTDQWKPILMPPNEERLTTFHDGFLPLLLEFKHAEYHVDGGGGPGCVRGGIPCTPSPTFPSFQHFK